MVARVWPDIPPDTTATTGPIPARRVGRRRADAAPAPSAHDPRPTEEQAYGIGDLVHGDDD
jgi:hypothetical protein